MRGRREHPALLPGIAKARIVGDDQAVHAVLDALHATCTVTEPALYPGAGPVSTSTPRGRRRPSRDTEDRRT
ncbi:hypothetical protein ACIP4W_41180 [Streptomyces sp. NPDC088846]|uniref:hypothetical protein n=1 Tax=Streptomyces sp. NPDC088846 TaxID=3365908 RepID=UPI00381A294B